MVSSTKNRKLLLFLAVGSSFLLFIDPQSCEYASGRNVGFWISPENGELIASFVKAPLSDLRRSQHSSFYFEQERVIITSYPSLSPNCQIYPNLLKPPDLPQPFKKLVRSNPADDMAKSDSNVHRRESTAEADGDGSRHVSR